MLGGVEMAAGRPSPESETPDAARVRKAWELVDDSARRQLALVNDLLDLSRIEAGRLRIDEEPFDLYELLESSAAMIRPLAATRGLRFGVELAPDLPRYVRGDALRVGQVLTNLLGNALKFTEAGEIRLRAYVCRTDGEDREIRCVVRDTGIGIARDQQSLIFQSFAQVDAAGNRLRQGAGLGLAISKQLAELMHGRLEVESRPGEGSAFLLAWPYTECEAAEPNERDVAASETCPPPAGLNVLVVDDSTAGRRVLEAMLADLGHRGKCFADGTSAIEAFRKSSFDVVLLDLNMPNLDGIAVAEELRECERDQGRRRTVVWLVTADAVSEATKSSDSADVDGRLIKPFSRSELAQVLQAVSSASSQAGEGCESAESAESPNLSARELVLERRLGGNRALLDELVSLFLSEAPRSFDRLQQAVSESRNEDAFHVAHLLQGQLRMLGQPAGDLVRDLEMAAQHENASELNESFDLLRRQWPRILDDVNAMAACD
ncbi:MAG: ATP-binding protein [Pirellulales bacterium]